MVSPEPNKKIYKSKFKINNMAIAKYLRQAWKKPDKEILRQRMIKWRKENNIVKVEKPLRLDRARALGYKAKKGIVVVRIKISRGGRKRPRPREGRRTKRMTIKKILKMNYKEVAEQKVARKYKNMEIVGSYWIGKDGINYFYEIILADRNRQEIRKDKQLGKLVKSPRGKSFRGLTSSGKKARGLRNSPVKSPKVRPSLRANLRQGN